ncbi:MAG: uracil-DNA glycosylase family protein, partial [Bacteroidota bacterium]
KVDAVHLRMSFAEKMLAFIKKLRLPLILPDGIKVMTPFEEPAALQACKVFYKKFYNDQAQRHMIIGINPGRFGGGITGIPFTDPIRLQNDCGIENSWAKKQELSSLYIYEMIRAFGGVDDFYRQFYITAVSPLGFTQHGKNLNYYDDKTLQDRIRPFIVDCLNKQCTFGIRRDLAFCLGDGKNYKYLSKLNAEEHFFEKIVPLSHPRFIMQYRLKKKQDYIDRYLQEFSAVKP